MPNPDSPNQGFKNLSIVTADAAGLSRGAWEMLQNPALLDIYAKHYNYRVINQQGLLIAAKKLSGLGIVRAQVFSPECHARDDWHERLTHLPAGEISVMTNRISPNAAQQLVSNDDLYSFVIDLNQGEDTLLARCERRCRKAIRAGARSGMEIQTAKTTDEIRNFYNLCIRVTANGKRYSVPPCGLLEELWSANFGRLYIATMEEVIVGGVFVLVDNFAHGLLSAFDVSAAGGVSSNYLYWNCILREAEQGTQFLDLGTQPLSENSQLVMFKRSFSPMLIPAYRYELHPSRLRASAFKAWRGLRNKLR